MTPKYALAWLRRMRQKKTIHFTIYGDLVAVIKSLLQDRHELQIKVDSLERARAAWIKRTTAQPEDKLTWDLPKEIR